MVYFNKSQKTFRIGNFLIGGQPGENPTFLFGGIRTIGSQNKAILKRELKNQKALSEELNIPGSVDLFIRKEEHIQERIDFIAENISEPFLIDLPFKQIELKKEVLRYISKKNLQERIIYNSINFATSDEELEMLKNYGIKSAILLALDMANLGTNGSLNLLEKKLLPFAEKAGIENTLIDPGTMGFNNGDIAGEVLNSIIVIKSETGLPTGCAMVNLPESWEYFKDKKNKIEYLLAVSAANALAQDKGADFLLYGPLQMARCIFPTTAMINKIYSETNKKNFGMEREDD